MINRVVLIGRITKDVDARSTTSGISVVQFTVAVNRNFKSANGENEADFVQCVAWRQTADFMKNYVRKGALLGVEGRIQTRNYEDTNGRTVYVTEVVADSVQLLESKDASTRRGYEDTSSPSEPQDDFFETSKKLVADDDLPF
ncbi:Helix-destabilizing protein [Acholeplasma oculi]|uniref:Single-stranded DNA-binding protein n=1 Tax=Acholeplasma oculi TaxID=35623 RepID=A0A061ABV0_9MOLU|nr:single-stranded DNA-binding protein [Acholeplasma oculi]CDR31345.1 Single-stranded DNA-binding protein Ssb [Acholeplasma oculi]SKC39229.1 single-strand binding protein [Acholeplasma oculi]SUT91704.1 Helix-destabilizing protein [Acholeplasma oculi]